MSSGEAAREEPSAGALSFAYVTNFAALASSAPFFAVYLGDRRFGGEEVSTLLAAILLVNVVATLAWTALADRLGSIGTILRIVSVGSVVCALPAFFGSRFAVVAGLLALAACRAPFGALLDALLLRTDRPFGPVRAWGTAGYVTGALAAGLATKLLGAPGIAFASVALLVLAAVASFFVPSARFTLAKDVATPAASAPFSSRLGAILGRPRFLLLLAIALLSEVGLAPYDALFPAYLTHLSDGVFAAAALAVGAVAEFVFLLALGRGTHRSRAGTFLVLASACSTLRWAIVWLVASPAALVATQALHAFSFGAFYVGAILLVDEESPASSATMSQGVFRAFTFGLAPAAVLFVTGRVEPRHGLRGAFFAAAVAAVGATVLALKVRAMSAKARARILLT